MIKNNSDVIAKCSIVNGCSVASNNKNERDGQKVTKLFCVQGPKDELKIADENCSFITYTYRSPGCTSVEKEKACISVEVKQLFVYQNS